MNIINNYTFFQLSVAIIDYRNFFLATSNDRQLFLTLSTDNIINPESIVLQKLTSFK